MRPLLLCASVAALGPSTVAGQDGFRMTIRDAFNVTGRGVIVTGVVEGASVSVNDMVCLRPAEGGPRELTVAGIEMFREVMEVAEPGTAVGLLFEEIEPEDVAEGDILTDGCG